MKYTIAKTTTEEIEIELPAFFKDNYSYYAIIDEDNIIRTCNTGVNNWHSRNDALSGTPITEAEFLEAYDKALAKIEYPNVPA